MNSFFQHIPHGWRRTPLKFLAEIPKNGAWGGEAGEGEVDAICVRVADFAWDRLSIDLSNPTIRSFKENQISKLRLRKGDLVLEKSGGGEKTPVGRIVKFDGDTVSVTSNFVARVRPVASTDSGFLLYMLAAQYMSRFSLQFIKQNTGIQNLDDTSLFRSDVWVPDLPTQQRIAAFLDRETARIDELIAKKERLVEVLWQRTRSMIDLLTSPDSDDDDWVDRPIKALCSINGRIGFRGYTVDDIVAEHEGAITLSPSNIKNGSMRFDSCTYLSWKKYFESPEIQVAEGDIVFVKTGSTIGKVARIDSVHTEMTINPQLVVLKELKVDGDFLLYSMQSSDFEYQVSYNQFGGSTPAMSQGNLGRLTVWIPKVDGKAKQIAATIKAHNTSVAKQRELINLSIDRLREYRAALITAAVTGQIDVETYGKAGATSETLDRIEEEMQA